MCLIAVAHHRDGYCRLVTDRLEEYLIPKRPEAAATPPGSALLAAASLAAAPPLPTSSRPPDRR
jgi:hypothetical protein